MNILKMIRNLQGSVHPEHVLQALKVVKESGLYDSMLNQMKLDALQSIASFAHSESNQAAVSTMRSSAVRFATVSSLIEELKSLPESTRDIEE